jgi:hypothetical protein
LRVESTSLNRGEGLAAGWLGVFTGLDMWWGGRRWWWKDERERAKINLDGVDAGFKLRSPSKITLDISVSEADSKIKDCITLKIVKRS